MVIRQAAHLSPLASIDAIDRIECGKEALSHFMFEPGYRNLNHGSFGTHPKMVADVLHFYQRQAEANPDKFIRYTFPGLLDESRKVVAGYLNAPVETCVLVPNATTALNTILRNLVYQPGDVIIYCATIYGAIEKTIEYLVESTPVESFRIGVSYPLSDDEICEAYEQAIHTLKAMGKRPKLAVFDTISSMPGVRTPYERLTAICRSHGVLSCIDGAHSIGQIATDLATLAPDYFVTNCHKWLFVPRGCAVLYVPLRHQPLMRSTLPTSHGFNAQRTPDVPILSTLPPTANGAFVDNFQYVGTLDSTPYLTLPAALRWRSKLAFGALQGEPAIHAYCHHLARHGGAIVATRLATEVLAHPDASLAACAFTNVRLPLSYREIARGELPTAIAIAQWMSRVFLDDYATFIAVILHADAFWVRLSAQVYLTLDDFEWAGDVLLQVCKRVREGEWQREDAPP